MLCIFGLQSNDTNFLKDKFLIDGERSNILHFFNEVCVGDEVLLVKLEP
jgi:hypothetical protein